MTERSCGPAWITKPSPRLEPPRGGRGPGSGGREGGHSGWKLHPQQPGNPVWRHFTLRVFRGTKGPAANSRFPQGVTALPARDRPTLGPVHPHRAHRPGPASAVWSTPHGPGQLLPWACNRNWTGQQTCAAHATPPSASRLRSTEPRPPGTAVGSSCPGTAESPPGGEGALVTRFLFWGPQGRGRHTPQATQQHRAAPPPAPRTQPGFLL